MPNRRILSLWFPRLAAERLLRQSRGMVPGPFAVVGDHRNAQVLVSLSAEAEAAGLRRWQPLRDALAMCPGLDTRLANPQLDAAFLSSLRRWAGKFSPWVAEEKPEALVVDLTGCAHLFGGEAALMAEAEADCAALGLSVCAGIGDTVGAAWALARFAGGGEAGARTGDDIAQEARATRSRAARRRHWERGGPAPAAGAGGAGTPLRIAPPGRVRAVLAPLPVAALRIDGDTHDMLVRLGLRRIGDLAGQPRAALARRFGRRLVQRLDQALGIEPEPVSPARAERHFAVRLTLPEPIGLETDIAAGIDRLLPALGERLTKAGRGARRVRLECHRCDHTMQWVEVGLARPSAEPDRIRPLLSMKIAEIDAGFGIDRLRLVASVTEPVHARQHSGHAEAAADGLRRQEDKGQSLDDLIGRIGARIGLDAIHRYHPGDSHIPEKETLVVAAAWSVPAGEWPAPPVPRPPEIWPPEIVVAPPVRDLPMRFRWRGRDWEPVAATGPERIAPEWWLDEPAWRSGVRDYWRVTTRTGERLWLYFAHGGAMSPGWFCQGVFS